MIDDRLQAIINFIPNTARVADIGTDHGYLAIELAKKNIFVIAGDKNFAPCIAAKKNIVAAGFNIEVRQGDGLKILRAGEVDTICVAGMGGSLICEILSNSPDILQTVDKIILQPMNAVDKVLNWIDKNNFFVGDIDLAEVAGIIYEIILVVKNPAEISAVTKKNKSPLLIKFFEQRLNKLLRIQAEMLKSSTAISTEKFSQVQAEIKSLEIKINRQNSA